MNYDKVFSVCKELYAIREYTIDEEIRHSEEGWVLKGMNKNNNKVHLYIVTLPKLNTDLIKYYFSVIFKDNISHAIIVYQNSVTSSVKKIISNNDIHIELFCIDELHYNILKHELVPRHTKIDWVKKNTLQYPILKKTDPVARFMGFKTGDVIKIERKNDSLYYSYVR